MHCFSCGCFQKDDSVIVIITAYWTLLCLACVCVCVCVCVLLVNGYVHIGFRRGVTALVPQHCEISDEFKD